MIATDIKIGQRVLVKTNNMTAIVVGRPEYYTARAKLVRIKFKNSTRYESMFNLNLDLLPVEEQYPAHRGTPQRAERTFQ